MYRILVVEDEPLMAEFMSASFAGRKDLEFRVATTFQAGLVALAEAEYTLVITDMKLPDGNGLDILDRVRMHHPLTEVIVVTAYGTVETAVKAMRLGATDFITKPFTVEELETAVAKALEHYDLVVENRYLRREIGKKYDFSKMIGTSEKLKRVFSMMSSVVENDVAILIGGESGTGKDLVARTIHFNSPRAPHPFLPINCAAIPATLLESELFGHRKGSFTGATSDKLGLLLAANGGTLFLDEIGDLPGGLQAKLLRFLESKEVLPVGATRPVTANVRVIAATNRDLLAAVKAGEFREDLYYRLNVIPIHLPPLRERREDILPLAVFFLERFCLEQKRPRRQLTREAERALRDYDWPGNIRELENLICRAVTLAKGAVISSRDLNLAPGGDGDGPDPAGEWPFDLDDRLGRIEEQYLREAVRRARGVKTDAAKLLGLKRTTFLAKLRRRRLLDLAESGPAGGTDG